MKIKNILHNAALRFCLVAAAAIAVIAATAAYTATYPQPNTGTVAENLVSVTSFDFNAENVGNLAYGTYYENNLWYYFGDTQDRLENKGGEKCIKWGLSYGIVFKIAEAGEYTLTVSYYNSDKLNGIWVYKGTDHKYYFDEKEGQSVKQKADDPNSCGTCTFTITTTEADECWQVSGITTANEYLHSISLTKDDTTEPEDPEPSTLSTTFPSDIAAINSNTFWYHNNGYGFGGNGENGSFYRYFTQASAPYSPTSDNLVTINGQRATVNPGEENEHKTGTYKTYQIKSGDAIGFKLEAVKSETSDEYIKDYRIKIYYYYVETSTATGYGNQAEAVLLQGPNVTSAWGLGEESGPTTSKIKAEYGAGTDTRLRTYTVTPDYNNVYWIKNTDANKTLYLGGFEILPINSDYPSDSFTGSWDVVTNAYPYDMANIDYGNTPENQRKVSVATSHNNVVVSGPAMALNDYQVDGKQSVMLNWGNFIGVKLRPDATLTLNYTSDDFDSGVKLVENNEQIGLSTEDAATKNYNKYSNYVGHISYTNETDDYKVIWIAGNSSAYAYVSTLEVEGGYDPVPTTPSIDNVTPISENYVWYPVAGKNEFAGVTNIYTDEKDGVAHTFLKSGFWDEGTDNAPTIRTKNITVYKQPHLGYRTSNNEIGFKIESGKKGVINIYYSKETISDTNSNLRTIELSESGTKVSLDRVDRDDAIYAQYHFDTTDGEKTYWMSRGGGEVWFGGFEVLFDVKIGEAHGLYRGIDNTYTVTEGLNTDEITNALGDDKYKVIKGSPVCGPAMIIRQPATDINGVVLFNRGDVRNSILMNVSNEYNNIKYLNVTGYLDGATIRIYKGAPSSSNTAYVEVTGSEKIDKIVSLESLGDISGAYYVTSNDAAGAYLTSLTLKGGTFTELQPTDVNYIYKVNGVPSSGVQNSGDTNGRILFIDGGNAAQTDGNSKMNVLGSEVTPVAIENGNDFFAVKVDQGPGGVKTGYVKVYFNGGNSGNHILQELPLDDPMYSGWNSSYDNTSHVISFGKNGGGRGWWFGDEGAGAKDLSDYNKINIEIGEVTGSPNLQVVVQSSNGAYASFLYDSTNKRILGDLTDETKWHTNKGATFDITKISQIYIQDNNTDDTTSSVEIKSARLMNKPIVIAKGTDENSDAGYTELFGGKIYNIDGGYVYEYPFDLSKADQTPQLTWITGAGTTGTINIAAIEVLYDTQHAKVVDWYVNKDTKMIVGSDDPSFTMTFKDDNGTETTLSYPPDYDEYVTFYMSSGRQANVSFIMPEAVRDVYDWETLVNDLGTAVESNGFVDETKDERIAKTYGKHTIEVAGGSDIDKLGIGSSDKITFQASRTLVYNRHLGISADQKKISNDKETGLLYQWYGYSYDLPANLHNDDYANKNFCAGVSITATQKKKGEVATATVGGKEGQWKIYMRFVSYKAPSATNISNNVTVEKGQDGYDVYYTIDSSDPENYGVLSDTEKARTSTEQYYSSVGVNNKNCIFKAAQYINTPYAFYDDITKGKEKSSRSNVLKVVSKDLAVTNEINSVVYVKNTSLVDEQIFNVQKGGYMLTIPTGTPGWTGKDYKDKDGKGKTEKVKDKDGNEVSKTVKYYDQPYSENPLMYLTLGGKDNPYYNNGVFDVCGTNWKASDDSGLKTYLDSYQKKMDVDGLKNPSWWKDKDGKFVDDTQQQNPSTECNRFVGGEDTEDGGMFLQPIGGAMLRFEPEFDGVITVWLRQNGCLDNNTQEQGTFTRRPVYVMDENGRIMRRSTFRPTAEHYMGINGTWAINSNVCEERSQVEHTWLYEVAKQAFADHPIYANRFGTDFPNRWETLNHDHSGHILYGWWYKGFDLDATRYRITSADHVSRFEYMEPQLLYRSDNIFNMEMNRLGLEKQFAKYGYELPNFQYVRYRIPVKAGKTYYIAGRGTKNGFSAIRFDALKPNTNISGLSDLRYKDNPVVEENQTSGDDYLKVSFNWDNVKDGNAANDLSGMDASAVYTEYGDIYMPKLTIYENGKYNISNINSEVFPGGNLVGMDELGNLVGKTMDVTLNRTFKAGYWHPIILPFSLSETRVEQYFGYGTVILYLDPYKHTTHNRTDAETGKSWTSVISQALDGTKLSFTLHRYQMLYANTPAFICPTFDWTGSNLADKGDCMNWWGDDNEDKTNILKKKKPATDKVKPVSDNTATEVSNITFKRVTLDGSNSVNFLSEDKNKHSKYIGYAISSDYEVVGSYDCQEEDGDMYYVNNKTENGATVAELVHSTGGTKQMKGTRVWIRPRTGAVNPTPIMTVGSRGFSDFEEDSELTGISDVVADGYTIEGYDIEDDNVYDMLGRKVGYGSLDGLLKGVYIFQGRKVYVK